MVTNTAGLAITESQRSILLNAKTTMRQDPMRGLIECITNSDDSYTRLEYKGIKVTGDILIEFSNERNS